MHPQKFPTFLIVAMIIILFGLKLASPAWAAEYKVLYRFRGGHHGDGQHPTSRLVLDGAGNLYGTTESGGTGPCTGPWKKVAGCGTVFKLTPNPDGSWTEQVLYSFTGGADGSGPQSELILDVAGNLYSTTLWGGTYGYGTVFRLIPNPDGSWTQEVLYSFTGGSDGASPSAGVILDDAGNLYGTTGRGGTWNVGTIFQLSPSPDGTWTESVLHHFTESQHDGAYPSGGLIWGGHGTLYGTTLAGGLEDTGSIFHLIPEGGGTWRYVHMANGRGWCRLPIGVIYDSEKNLYGTCVYGGLDYWPGAVFKLKHFRFGHSCCVTIIHSFKADGLGGAYPCSGLTLDAARNLYGTTSGGGPYGYGIVYKLTHDRDNPWQKSRLHTFKGKDGASPRAALVMDAAGNFYGTTTAGGRMTRCRKQGCGVVFKITP